MACSGAHCNNHSVGTSTCAQHRGFNGAGWYGHGGARVNQLAAGTTIKASDIANLRTQIRKEIDYWNSHRSYDPKTGVTSRFYYLTHPAADPQSNQGQLIKPSSPKAIHNKINTATGHARSAPAPDETHPETVYTGNRLNAYDYNRMVQEYIEMKQDCICNSDCSCNVVCTCHNNCGCNYSDEKLKVEIKYC